MMGSWDDSWETSKKDVRDWTFRHLSGLSPDRTPQPKLAKQAYSHCHRLIITNAYHNIRHDKAISDKNSQTSVQNVLVGSTRTFSLFDVLGFESVRLRISCFDAIVNARGLAWKVSYFLTSAEVLHIRTIASVEHHRFLTLAYRLLSFILYQQ